jgi:hypothetical protein
MARILAQSSTLRETVYNLDGYMLTAVEVSS